MYVIQLIILGVFNLSGRWKQYKKDSGIWNIVLNKYSDTLHKIEDPLWICELQSALNEDQCAQREF